MHPIRSLLPALVMAVSMAACGGGESNPGANGGSDEAGVQASGEVAAEVAGEDANPAPAYETVAADLEVPWDLGFAPDGRVFVTERPGRIRVIEKGALRAEPWATLQVAAVGEAGLTSIAVDPAFRENGYVYVLATFERAGGLENRIVRFRDQNGRGVEATFLVSGLPAGRLHAGSALDFGPDGLLYATAGDAGEPRVAQAPESLGGKLLRYTRDGTPAPGNALPGPVQALGLRNSQGLDWNRAGELYATDHGPSGLPWEGGRRGDDELNRIVPGANYGWPEVAGRGGGDQFREPLVVWDPAIAPSGLAIYTGRDFPEWRGHAFVGGLRGRQLRRVALDRGRLTGQEALFEGDLGRIRAVVMAPDGALYFTTSNRDGRGDPATTDDRVLRLVPR